ncbi:hypothetical protein ACU8KH_01695 [Lachancea thermotolerans]
MDEVPSKLTSFYHIVPLIAEGLALFANKICTKVTKTNNNLESFGEPVLDL